METSQSYLFTIRIWAEGSGDPGVSWRGQVVHVLSGERQYFRDWDTLVQYLQVSAHTTDHLRPGETERTAGGGENG